MRQRKSTKSVWTGAALLLGLLLAAALPAAAAATGRQGDTGTVRIAVSYKDAAGRRLRLTGVEVLLLEVTPGRHMGPVWHPRGNERYVCTNANGVAVFRDVPAGADLWAVTGVGHPGVCANAQYLNPSNGKKMLSVDWRKVDGGGYYLPFLVGAGEVRTISLLAPTPPEQDEICGGFYVTWTGTPGDDVYLGTPEADVIIAGEGNDRIDGGGGWDVICAGPGQDVVRGGADGDVLIGEDGRDILIGGTGADWLFGGPGSDTCRSGDSAAECESIG